MIVYLITAGRYSDYQVYSVSLDKQDAYDQARRLERIIKDQVKVQQRDTDLMRNMLDGKIHSYRVVINADTNEILSVKEYENIPYECTNYPNFFEVFTRNGQYITTVFAEDEDRAKKAALDRYYIAKADAIK